MKRKIRCIYIDGMEKTGKTSIVREMRRFLKEKDLYEISGESESEIDRQQVILEDNINSVVLKENGLMTSFHKELSKHNNLSCLKNTYEKIIRKEQDINQRYGAVHFFLVPEDRETIDRIFYGDQEPDYYQRLASFYKTINQTYLTQGLDVKLIVFGEHDRIFDVRDEILKILKNEYEI